MKFYTTFILSLFCLSSFSQNFTKIISQGQFSRGNALLEDGQGNIFCSGILNDERTIYKFDNFGNRLWTKTYLNISCGTPFEFQDLEHSGDGNFLTSSTDCPNSSATSFLPEIIKFNNSGEVIWRKVFPTSTQLQNANSVFQTKIVPLSDGDFLVYGIVESSDTRLLIVKFSASGEQIWWNRYRLDSGINGAVVRNVGEKIYIFSETLSPPPLWEPSNRFTILDLNGAILTDKKVNYMFGNHDMLITKDKNFVSSFIEQNDTTNLVSFKLAKVDTLGQILWEQTYPTPGEVYVSNHFTETDSGKIKAIIGTDRGFKPVFFEFDSKGTFIDSIHLNFSSKKHLIWDAYFTGEILTGIGQTSYTIDNLLMTDFLLARYNTDRSSSVNQLELREEKQIKIFGNPSRDQIKFELPYSANWNIEIIDRTGNLRLKKKIEGTEAEILRKDTPSGLYFLIARDQEGRTFNIPFTFL